MTVGRRRPARRVRVAVVLGVVSLVATACGKEVRYQLPPPEATTPTTARVVSGAPRTTVARSATTRVAPSSTVAPAPWRDVTANLVGVPSECGDVSYMSSRPDADIVMVGVALRGLWASVDGADSWTQLGTGPGSAQISNRFSSALYDPVAPGTFWQSGLYNANGVYVTEDGGVTFRPLGTIRSIDHVSVDLTDPARQTMLAVSHEVLDLQRSLDGGRTWATISAGVPGVAGQGRGAHVVDARTYLFGTRAGTDSGIFRTEDGGATWTQVQKGAVAGRPIVTRDGTIYWLFDGGGGMVKSEDKGKTWTRVTRAGLLSPIVTEFEELPDGRFATLSSHVIVSSDKGATWQTVGPALPYPPTGFTYAPKRKAFYVYKFDCQSGSYPVAEKAIMRWDWPDGPS